MQTRDKCSRGIGKYNWKGNFSINSELGARCRSSRGCGVLFPRSLFCRKKMIGVNHTIPGHVNTTRQIRNTKRRVILLHLLILSKLISPINTGQQWCFKKWSSLNFVWVAQPYIPTKCDKRSAKRWRERENRWGEKTSGCPRQVNIHHSPPLQQILIKYLFVSTKLFLLCR